MLLLLLLLLLQEVCNMLLRCHFTPPLCVMLLQQHAPLLQVLLNLLLQHCTLCCIYCVPCLPRLQLLLQHLQRQHLLLLLLWCVFIHCVLLMLLHELLQLLLLPLLKLQMHYCLCDLSQGGKVRKSRHNLHHSAAVQPRPCK
jgi:hypothetical protein